MSGRRDLDVGHTVRLPDTHAHLDKSVFASDLDQVLARAHEAGVDRILAVGSDLRSSVEAVETARRYGSVYAAVGVHPHEAVRFDEEAESVRKLLDEERVVAIGEIGLDYYRAPATREVQLKAFRAQLHWARERSLTVSVHNRSADADVLAALAEIPVRAILHCFSGSREFARSALDAGHYLSFAGNLTYPKAGSLRDVAACVPLDRVLVETDSPVLAPQPWRGRRNEPAYIVATAKTLASLAEVEVPELARAIRRNADRLFPWRPA